MAKPDQVILIVDDSRTIREMLRQALEELNFKVQEAESGEDALSLFQQIAVDLVLLDVEMPGLDGFATCRELRRLSPDSFIPIIMITGLNDMNSVNKSYDAGATDFITKPFNWNLLPYRLRYIIRTSNDFKELQHKKEELINAQDRIKNLNDDLEVRVEERTRELIDTNQSLNIAVQNLKRTQNQLLESEKIAYIGSLMTSIANEANIPLDAGNAAVMQLQEKLAEMANLIGQNTLTKKDLENFILYSQDTAKLLGNNLQNSSALIKSFKQISIDQIMETRKTINLKESLEDFILRLKPAFKNTRLQSSIQCDDDIIIETYPGVLFQVVSILIMNSITHAFKVDEKGSLTITVHRENNRILIKYSDTGKGMSPDMLKKIFEPIFTTSHAGKIGLGLHIAYNQVVQILGGSIHCESEPGHGTTFIIAISPGSGEFKPIPDTEAEL